MPKNRDYQGEVLRIPPKSVFHLCCIEAYATHIKQNSEIFTSEFIFTQKLVHNAESTTFPLSLRVPHTCDPHCL